MELHHSTASSDLSKCQLISPQPLSPGYHANIIVFSAEEIGTPGNYVEPDCVPQGIEHVLVNGALAVRQGRVQQCFSGRAVRN